MTDASTQYHYTISPFNIKVEMIRVQLATTIDNLEQELMHPDKLAADTRNEQTLRQIMTEHAIDNLQAILSMVDEIGEIVVPKECSL